ncbi:MAG: hypothetical protein M0R00_06325 [Candidatus Omnitrophica bacterium]|jgi:hypothetical protein|nr:hypothetical protein [Candidatus Omnitrophota bacterium]
MQVKFGALPGVYKTGEKFSDILAYNHFGTETIPPRPVLRIAAENILSSPAMKKHMKAYFKNVTEYSKRGRTQDAKDAETEMLTALGQQVAAEAKRIIKDGGELQHNAPSTIAKKGSGKPPLFDKGELIKKLSYEVTE